MSIFANVYTGNTANDGTGTPLRNAFEIIDQNFAKVDTALVNLATNAYGVRSIVSNGVQLTGNVQLTVNNVYGAASTGYVNALAFASNTYIENVAANVVSTHTLDQTATFLNANIIAANTAVAVVQNNLNSFETYANATFITSSGTYGDSDVASYLPNYTGSLSNSNSIQALNSDVNALQGNVNNLQTQINNTNANVIAANAAIITANTAVVGYVNALIAPIAANTTNIIANENNLYGAMNNITTIINVDLPAVNANVVAANVAIVTANTAVVGYINSLVGSYSHAWQSNAAFQQTQITALQANIFAANIALNLSTTQWQANSLSQESKIRSVQANVTAANSAIYQNNLAITTSNASVVSYVNTQVGIINSNLGSLYNIVNGNIISLTNSIAGVTTAWQSNAGTQSNQIANLQNQIAGANAAIVTAGSDWRAYADSISVAWTANATTQETAISGLRANIIAANAAIVSTKQALSSNIAIVNANVSSANAAIVVNTNAIDLLNTNVSILSGNLTSVDTYYTGITTNLYQGQIASNTAISKLQANVGSFYTYANAAYTNYSNVNVAAYLSGNIRVGNILSAANVTSTVMKTPLLSASSVEAEFANVTTVNVYGNVTASNIGLNSNTGFPTDSSTIKGWARITIAGVAFWTPLYQ